MRFELQVALKYLIPKKRGLSTALISVLSIFLISLVIWLVLVFLSVTSGMEKNWLKKLTALHAPIRISPTDQYYSSYYYKIDSLASNSNYCLKTIGEKNGALSTDPYSEESDFEIPPYWPPPDYSQNGTLRDPVKLAMKELETMRAKIPKFAFQDYEISGALLKVNLANGSSISQMTYLMSIPENNPRLPELVYRNNLTNREFDKEAARVFASGASDHCNGQGASEDKKNAAKPTSSKTDSSGCFGIYRNNLKNREFDKEAALVFASGASGHCLRQGASEDQKSAAKPTSSKTDSSGCFGIIHSTDSPDAEGLSIYLPKSYLENGVSLQDRATLNFLAPSAASLQEQRLDVRIGGFYDPGVLAIGNKCILAPSKITRSISTVNQTISPDGTPTNGIFVWIDDLSRAKQTACQIGKAFEKAGIASYWKIVTYEDFEFSKDLLLQFQNDRTILLVVASIILIVACSNIISLLILLVNDKKKEIAILQSLGASFSSIAAIFAICGIVMGTLGCIFGSLGAIFTLRHLDSIVSFLSHLQGRAIFNPVFFGQSLPNQLSGEALVFVLIITPLLSLAAGLIPAFKASRIHPSPTLRSE